MQVAHLMSLLALAAGGPQGSAAEVPEKKVAAPAVKENSESKGARGETGKKPVSKARACPEWLLSNGLPASEEDLSPKKAEEWARLLAREKSHAAASRAYEALLRRWPGSDRAEGALLAAAQNAVAARQYDRARKLVEELRARWLEGKSSVARDRTEVSIGERRLSESLKHAHGSRASKREAKAAYRVFGGILKRDRAGPVVERATLGRAQALYRMNRIARAIKTLEVFLREFPRSDLIVEARRRLAAYQAERVSGRSPESDFLKRTGEQKGHIQSYKGGNWKKNDDAAIRRTFEAIAERQAELKIAEAKLYVKLKKPRAAEWVLRSVLRRYGSTRSAKKAAEMLEELAER